MRFGYDEMVAFLKRGDVARREGWSRGLCIEWSGGFMRDGTAVALSDEDRAASDWIVYRRA